MSELINWLKSGDYLPAEFRDFHDQKDLFKAMHWIIENANENGNARDGHIYVVDTFLWYMASRGYTLQRSRKKVNFKEISDDVIRFKSESREFLKKH
ncbi:TPA: hypothetical protein ACW96C_004513 [Yersinia enterocolitica]|uniref:hypothetical protein n=1 Tax=Yersinia enterocolitica TaxID=630 RepID=UPI0029630CC2|nr:hypothetical protein [Yersinia enterocolitica]HDM8442155.1 hypothetical protein [Yersinia enterocolitica]HEF7241496.1 hypothetical protein [Yersinia enterocolitica]HEN3278033.1 hypothetical protein [Yersinia enterocolitica]